VRPGRRVPPRSRAATRWPRRSTVRSVGDFPSRLDRTRNGPLRRVIALHHKEVVI
jgi:hypothetical protein